MRRSTIAAVLLLTYSIVTIAISVRVSNLTSHVNPKESAGATCALGKLLKWLALMA